MTGDCKRRKEVIYEPADWEFRQLQYERLVLLGIMGVHVKASLKPPGRT